MKDRHQAPSYPLRLPSELKKRIEEAAGQQGRSLNAEIIARLESTFAPQRELFSQADLMDALARIETGVTEVQRTVAPQKVKIRGKFVEIPEFDTKLVRGRATKPPSPRSGPVNKLIPIPGGLERYQAVLDRRVPAEPLAPKPSANKGPTRSANARRPAGKK